MTDEQMDARLQAAGQRWRTATDVAEPQTPAANEPVSLIPARAPRRRWPLLASAAVIAAALVVGGTLLLRNGTDTPRPSGDVAGLPGHVWLLTGVPGTKSSATLYISDGGQLVADDECRLIGAHATIDGSALTVTDVATRDKACTDQYGPGFYNGAEQVLQGSSHFRITSDALTISRDGRDLRFVLAPQNVPAPSLDFPTLEGSWWRLTNATDASGRSVAVPANQDLRLDNGKINGSMGCQKFGASASISGDQVRIGEYFVPALACAASPAARVLTGTVRAAVDGAQLTIAKGRATLVYRWLPADSAGHDPAQFENRTWYLTDNAGTAVPVGTSFRVSGAIVTGDERCALVTRVDVEAGALRAAGLTGGSAGCTEPHPIDGLWSSAWRPYSIQKGRLLIFSAAQADPLVFTSTVPTSANSSTLDGTWNYVIPGASMAVFEQFTIRAGTITIAHRCYSNRGDVTVTSSAVSVTNVRLYRAVPCAVRTPNLAASERVADARLDQLLGGRASWTLQNRVLTVSLRGVPSMTFERTSGP